MKSASPAGLSRPLRRWKSSGGDSCKRSGAPDRFVWVTLSVNMEAKRRVSVSPFALIAEEGKLHTVYGIEAFARNKHRLLFMLMYFLISIKQNILFICVIISNSVKSTYLM